MPSVLRTTESFNSKAPLIRSASCPGVNRSMSWHLRGFGDNARGGTILERYQAVERDYPWASFKINTITFSLLLGFRQATRERGSRPRNDRFSFNLVHRGRYCHFKNTNRGLLTLQHHQHGATGTPKSTVGGYCQFTLFLKRQEETAAAGSAIFIKTVGIVGEFPPFDIQSKINERYARTTCVYSQLYSEPCDSNAHPGDVYMRPGERRGY